MGRSRRRSGGRRSVPFRAWGLVLTVLTALLVSQRSWLEALFTTGVLIFYFAVVRMTRCRVETREHRPCLYRVRGVFGTCDYHVGYKRSFPVLVRGDGFVGLPTFMWRRDRYRVPAGQQQAVAMYSAGAEKPRSTSEPRSRYDQVMMFLAASGVVVAVLALIRDFLAG